MPNTYTSTDFSDILENLRNFFNTQENFKDYNFDGSGLSFLMRLLAYTANQQAYQDNMLFNELHLDTATQDNNVASVAGMLGYTPGSKYGAECVVNVTVTPSDISTAPTEIVMDKSVRFLSTKDNFVYTFSPKTENVTTLVDGKYTFSGISIKQGIWTQNSFNVTGLGIETYEIPNENIDISTILVSVQNSSTDTTTTTFTRFSSAHDFGTDSTVFFLSKGRNGLYRIEFGDGHIAKRLVDGNIILIQYMTTDGEEGNDINTFNASTSIDGYSNIVVTPVSARSIGGNDIETMNSIKKLAPSFFASEGSAVTSEDYKIITSKYFSETGDVVSWGGEDNIPRKPGYQFLAVKAKTSETLDETQKASLVTLLKKYNIGSITPVILDPEFYYINVETTVKYYPNMTTLDSLSLKRKIQDYVNTYSNSTLEKFSRSFELSNLITFITKIDKCIDSNTTLIKMERHISPILDFSGSYEIDFHHDVKPGSVYIDDFKLSDADTSVLFHITDDELGGLNLYRQNTLVGTIGTANYSTGKIILSDFRPHSTENGYIRCIVSSGIYDQDIDAVRQDIIKINTVTVELKAI